MTVPYPILNQNTVHIWQVHLSEFVPQIPAFFQLLSTDEKTRAERFKFDIHRNRFIVARAILRKILSLYLSVAPESIQFSYGPKGKPYLLNSTVFFNLTHSADRAVIAISSRNEIGVDIEQIKVIERETIAKRFFSETENQLLQMNAYNQSYFYRIWVKKEALIKAQGAGLFTALDSFSVTAAQSEKIQIDAQVFYVYLLSIEHAYEAALATLEPVEQIEYREWKNTE